MGFIRNGQSFLQCATLLCLRDHDPRRDVSGAPALFQRSRSIVNRLSDSSRFPPSQCQTHRGATSHDNHGAIQQSVLCSSSHVSYSAPESTAMSLAAACLTSVIAAKDRDARDMYSVSIASFGAQLGRPPMCLMFNKITQHHQTFSNQMLRHQVGGVNCATDLLDPELLVLLFLLQP